MSWSAHVLTIFPEMFPGPLGLSLTGRALDHGVWKLKATNIREAANDRHKTVDDAPFGGGAGMIMRPDIVEGCVNLAIKSGAVGELIYLTPRGAPLNQAKIRALSEGPGVVLLCGRYEGVDQRAIEGCGFEELSIGDYVLSGGEIAAMVLLDACVRLLPSVLGARESLEEESFTGDLLEYPQYTRPQVWKGLSVPETLLSGHHERIRAWRHAMAVEVTRQRRPDLLERRANIRETGNELTTIHTDQSSSDDDKNE
ncbi:MAG: tRNA (guanosine(37)-N1)-methyltransferase TrmD [Pseudomonadota bacterium]